jgi:ubiquinone/menaquinone biosynthesis C-methylase UbiE
MDRHYGDWVMPLASEVEIRQAYRGKDLAARYVGERFINELGRVLHEHQVAAVQAVMDRVKPARALEIAPGPGRLTRDVRPSNALICLEFNEGMVEQGRAACDANIAWVRGNGFQLPFASEFDLVYSFRFIRHFHRADRIRLYSQVRRVLRPGGFFVMDAVNEVVSRPLREAHPEEYPIHDELYHADHLRAELTASGFKVESLTPVLRRYTWQHRCQVVVGPRSARLNRLLVRTLERLPGGAALEWVVTCRVA